MDRGTYAATSSGLVQFRKLEVANHNLANVNTVGYKRRYLVGETQSFDQTLAQAVANQDPYARGDHARTPGVVHVNMLNDFTPGPILNTENPLDVSLQNPKDFFVINTPQGPQYTRAGNFALGGGGELVTVDGLPVQGDGGAITVNGGKPIIAPDGSVRVNGTQVGRVKVVRIDNPEKLTPAGASRYATSPGQGVPVDTTPALLPQSLEQSNVSAISSMIDLISANRAFAMYARSLESIDTLNQTAISQIGRPR